MKKIMKLTALLLTLAMLLGTALVLGSCKNEDDPPEPSTPITYTVNVADSLGVVPDGFTIIELYKDGEFVEQQRLNNGVATFSRLPGDYTFKVVLAEENKYVYDESTAVLSPTVTTASVILYNTVGNKTPLYVPCVNHTDSDGDYRCDNCFMDKHCPGFVDEDGNARCDICKTRVPCSAYVDNNGDALCDRCGVADHCIAFVDSNNNARCDNCDTPVPCCSFTDINSDGRCDICMLTEHCTTHVKAEGSKRCSECNMLIPCTSYTDSDGDAVCDTCGETVHCLELADVDTNGACDNCGGRIHCTVHKNPSVSEEVDDSSCDVCGAIVPCESYVDLNGDNKCDTCGAQSHCSGYADANGDQLCDTCHQPAYDSGGRVEYNAAALFEGASKVDIDRPEMTYFTFTPTRSGVFKLSYEIEGEAGFGNFGVPSFVQPYSVQDVVDNSFTVDVIESSIGTEQGGTLTIVFGISSATAKTAVIKIERISDVKQELGYEDLMPDENVGKYHNPLNNSYVDIDITDPSVKVVYNETDGYYHYGSKNGPLVLVKISKSGNSNLSSLTLPSFVEICDSDRMCKYFFDENGEIVRKESYNYLIGVYNDLAGSNGMRPLDKKMETVIKNTGEQNGWWNLSTGTGIFGADSSVVVADNAWLFACCYEVENTYGTEGSPIEVEPVLEAAVVELAVRVNGTAYLEVADSNATLIFTGASGVTVSCDGASYTADETGKIVVTASAGSTVTIFSDDSVMLIFAAVISD